MQPPNFASLTVTVNGGASGAEGSVNSDPGGIDQCSDDPNNPGICTASFPVGFPVTLTATPVDDQFAGWSGDGTSSCGMNLTCQIQITGNMNVTATFSPVVTQLYYLAVTGAGVIGSPPGTGTITSSPGGIDCGTGGQVCNFNFVAGTQVTLTAMPDPGSFFDGWSGNPACSGTGSCLIVMNSNQSVDYIFLANGAPPPQPDFTITVTPASLGTVPVGSQGVAGIAIVPLNQFSDTVNLSCSVLPASASSPSCTVSPSSLNIQANGAGSATLAVNTTGLTARRGDTAGAALAFCFAPLGALLGASVKSRYSRGRRNWLRLLLCATLLGVISFQLACGSSGGSGIRGGVAQAGNYTVVVEAQGASTFVSHSAEVTVTIQ